MAKGDEAKSQNMIDEQGSIAQNTMHNTWDKTENTWNYMLPQYKQVANQTLPNYNQIMGNYNSFLGGGNPGGGGGGGGGGGQQGTQSNMAPPQGGMNPDQVRDYVTNYYQSRGVTPNPTSVDYWTQKYSDPSFKGDFKYWGDRLAQADEFTGGGGGGGEGGGPAGAIQGWQQFAQTGGFSPQDIQDIRAHSLAPTKAIYQNAQDELERNRNLQGGYSPNYAAASTKLARDLSQNIAGTNVDVNAAIAQLRQQGMLSGLQGLTGAQLGAMQGATNLFGTAPGMMGTAGSQALAAQGQSLQNQELQQQLALGLIAAQNEKAKVPSNYQQALGNTAGTLGVIGKGAMLAGGM